FRGEVIASESRYEQSDWGPTITTDVTFRVDRLLKGDVGPTLTVNFLGGQVDGVAFEVEGSPTFAVGDREVVFLSGSTTDFSPILGVSQGLFRLHRHPATGEEQVGRGDVIRLGAIGSRAKVALDREMPLSDFETLVVESLR